MSSLSNNVTRKTLEMQYTTPYRKEQNGRDGYEGRIPNTRVGLDAARKAAAFTLVCGECGHRAIACDCPASVQRRTPLRPARDGEG